MSTLKVGMRCRVVWMAEGWEAIVGSECTILAPSKYTVGAWRCDIDGHPAPRYGGRAWALLSNQLAPLTPPNQPADADFAAQFDAQFREVFVPERVK